MSTGFSNEPMMDIFIFETVQLLEHLEQIIISNEKSAKGFDTASVNEIFRIMHTIKGSSAMMVLNNISLLSHAVEDLFFIIRENKDVKPDNSTITDIVLECLDFIRGEVEKLQNCHEADGDPSVLINKTKKYTDKLKSNCSTAESSSSNDKPLETQSKYYIPSHQTSHGKKLSIFKALIEFEKDCEMENIRAFSMVHNLKDYTEEIYHLPQNIIDDTSVNEIRTNGFRLYFKSSLNMEELKNILEQAAFVKRLDFMQMEDDAEIIENFSQETKPASDSETNDLSSSDKEKSESAKQTTNHSQSTMISVNTSKLDVLMDLVGELVVSEAMVTQNPEVSKLKIDSFQKASRHHRKIINELQDIAMSLRMIPISATFQKMNRIVRDAGKKLNKDIELEIIGQETEIDKNIVESLSDPLMHLVRNAADHGIEEREIRLASGKSANGRITLEARNAGREVIITVKDDGKGLDREKILQKAKDNGLVTKPDNELTDRDVFSFIFLPGFSTKENITELSGRGVGMDVVIKNVEKIGGSISVNSQIGSGSIFLIKIPLTLAIISGMNVKVGKNSYTIPLNSISECFRPDPSSLFCDPDGSEMIMVRGKCYPIFRLHKCFEVSTEVLNIQDGILIMLQNEDKPCCLFADALIGEQQIVVKPLPKYVKKVNGLAGCSILGDGSISLIIDTDAISEVFA